MLQITTTRSGLVLLRAIIPCAVMALCFWVLSGSVDWALLADLPRLLHALPVHVLGLAVVPCAISFWAVARYDDLAHRHFRTEIASGHARRSGFAAIALGQTIGFGVMTGAAVRWRMLPDLGMMQAAQLAAFVAASFLTALAFLTALTCILWPPAQWTVAPAFALTVGLPAFLVWASFAPSLAALRRKNLIPSLRACVSILGWTALDVAAAALALYILIPSETLGFAVFLPVFLIALGAALLSGAPGGVGPFEVTLIALLPQENPTEILAGIIAFRALYYALPAVIAACMLLSPLNTSKRQRHMRVPSVPAIGELGILEQNGGEILRHPQGSFACWTTPQTATMLFEPLTGSVQPALRALESHARHTNRIPLIYKTGARTARVARKNGWGVMRTAHDALVDLHRFDLEAPARRGLRRKLRKARTAGVTVAHPRNLPLVAMAELDCQWQADHGQAKGGTMGRFCPLYLARQDVFVAYREGKAIAFASFHLDATSLTLDLMRHAHGIPDGTMHLIIASAIEAAQRRGLLRVNLAAVPALPGWLLRIPHRAFRRACHSSGLRQFKACFATSFAPRYAAAPGPLSLLIGLADLTTEVHHPKPLGPRKMPHNENEDYEFALTS